VISILQAPPFLTVQDLGRLEGRIHGVPRSGAMDDWALASGNLLAGNPPGAAGLEWALGAGALRFETPTAFALTGATAVARLGDRPIPLHSTMHARNGEVLTVERLTSGRFLYLTFQGRINVPQLLGSRSTYLPGKFGGLEGRRLKAGDVLPLGIPSRSAPPDGFTVPQELRLRYHEPMLHVIEGPQYQLFGNNGLQSFLTSQFVVAPASDRMGYRLTGPAPQHRAGAALPSEPACVGAVQMPTGGAPIVLFMDGPTVGGYPKIAVVISADLPLLAQRLPGESVSFRLVSVAEAQTAYRQRVGQLRELEQLAGNYRRQT
jgi:antagonist of KipI